MAKLTKTEEKILTRTSVANVQGALCGQSTSPYDLEFYTDKDHRFLRRLFDKGHISFGRSKSTGGAGWFIPGTPSASNVNDWTGLSTTSKVLTFLVYNQTWGQHAITLDLAKEFFHGMGMVPNDIEDSLTQLVDQGFIDKVYAGWSRRGTNTAFCHLRHLPNLTVDQARELGQRWRNTQAA